MVGGGVAGMHTYPKPYSRRVAHAGALLWAAMAGRGGVAGMHTQPWTINPHSHSRILRGRRAVVGGDGGRGGVAGMHTQP